MNRNLKLSLLLVAVVAVVVVGIAAFTGDDAPSGPQSVAADDERLVRADSPRLTDGSKATFVEFLDFECEACGQLYPVIEEMKDRYGDDVSFVVRYMPLHTSSVNAARAAEAAAGEQGRYEDMYDVLFQRQTEWGHQETAEEDMFFGYAEELGLDMEQFRADYADPATLERIEASEADGRSLGVTGTPTMYLDGQLLQPESLDDFVASFDDAIAA